MAEFDLKSTGETDWEPPIGVCGLLGIIFWPKPRKHNLISFHKMTRNFHYKLEFLSTPIFPNELI
jgi:hypothetical protein